MIHQVIRLPNGLRGLTIGLEILKTKQVSELRDFMISDLVTLVSGLLVVVVDFVWTTGGRGYLQQA